MSSSMTLGLVIGVIGILILVCPYDVIKTIFPRAKSEKVLKGAGAVAAVAGIITIILELVG